MSTEHSENIIFRYRYFIIFAVFFLLYLGLAYHLVFNIHSVYGDAVTRTEKPFLVLFDNERKLASLGFIWPPLPSIIQLPMIAIFKPIAMYGFASNLTTVIFGALNAVLIFLFIEKIPVARWTRVLFLLLYGLNPMIVFYAVNGMSETLFLFFVIAIAWHFFQWQKKQAPNYHLLLMSFTLALAFLTRYETFALLGAMGGLVFATAMLKKAEGANEQLSCSSLFCWETLRKAFDMTIFSLIPVVFIIGVWMSVNWAIMGDPLYFFHGSYSVSEQSDMISGEAQATSHNIIDAAIYSLKRIVFLYPIFIPLVIFLCISSFFSAALNKHRRFWLIWSMILLAITIPAFEILVHYLGKSFGWLRFFIYIIPFTFILLSVMWHGRKRVHSIAVAGIVMLLSLSTISSGMAMFTIEYGKEEYRPIRAFLANTRVHDINFTYDGDVEVGNYLKMVMQPGERVLLDDFIGFGIILNHGDPKVFINDSDKEFDAAVANPDQYADYILIPSHYGVQKLDIMNQTYPGIFENGLSFTQLEKDFGKWRLYRVKK